MTDRGRLRKGCFISRSDGFREFLDSSRCIRMVGVLIAFFSGSIESAATMPINDSFASITMGMQIGNALQTMGEPDSIFTTGAEKDTVYLWQIVHSNDFTERFLLMVQDGRITRATHARSDLAEVLASLLDPIAVEGVPLPVHVQLEPDHPRTDLTYICHVLATRGASPPETGHDLMVLFDSIHAGMTTEEVIAAAGEPDRNRFGTATWNIDNGVLKIRFGRNRVVKKTLETENLTVEVEGYSWSAECGRITVSIGE